MKSVIAGCLLASVLLFFVFLPQTASVLNFWLASSATMGVLGAYAWYFLREERSQLLWFENRWITIGIASALALYALAFAGVLLLSSASPYLRGAVNDIYAYGNGTSRILSGTLLLFWLAPLEELFWRGFVQNRLMQRFGRTAGWLLATAVYVLAHFRADNVVLWLALVVAGLFWGWIFKRYQRLWPCIISHAVWDVLVFIVLPL